MEAVVQKILKKSVFEFQKANLIRTKDSILFIIDWWKTLSESIQQETDVPAISKMRRTRIIAALEVIQRELKVLQRLIDQTLDSVKNSN